MVRPGVPRGERRFFRGLRSDPSVETAARALNYGVADPMGFLDHGGVDWEILVAVVQRARQIYVEERRDELKALVDAIGKSVGRQVGETLARAFKA